MGDYIMPNAIWEPNERSALRPNNAGKAIQQTISAPLNPKKRDDGFFDLYYFVLTPDEGVA